MPVRCHVEHDGLGIVLSRIESIENAISLRCFFGEFGVGSAVGAPTDSEGGFHLILVGISLEDFKTRIAGARTSN